MLDRQTEVDPALVGPQLRVAVGAGEELAPRRVQGRNAGIAAAGEVDGGQIERQAQEVVAQRLDDELVDLVADLARHAAHDLGRGSTRIGLPLGVGERIEEGLDQPHLAPAGALDDIAVGVEPIDGVVQHRMAEAVDGVGELGDDRRVDVDLVGVEDVDRRLDLAGELLEHEVLVLHLGAELGRLEDTLAVPLQRGDLSRGRRERGGRGAGPQPLGEEGQVVGAQHHFLHLCRQPVVLRVEDVVDRGQADVLVPAAVTGDVVRVQELVVVGRRRHRRRCPPDRRRRPCRWVRPNGRCRRGRRGRCAWRRSC